MLDILPDQGNLEASTMPTLAKEGKIRVTKYERVHWRSIDTHKDIEEAQKEFEGFDAHEDSESRLASEYTDR